MDTDDFRLVREAFRAFAARARIDSADVKPSARAAAQEALDGLGLAELRRSPSSPMAAGHSSPLATGQECALLAEDHGAQPLATSFLGTVLLAPELLRLLGDDRPESDAAPTIALSADLGFPSSGFPSSGFPDVNGDVGEVGTVGPGSATAAVAWDCEGADGALHLAPDGVVTLCGLGSAVPSIDFGRTLRAAVPPAVVLGSLDLASTQRWQAFALVMVASELIGAARSFVQESVEYARERRQYGQPIGAFQAVQHLLADATVLVEAGLSATRYAAWCLDHEPPAAALHAARVAKAEVNRSAVEAIHTGMQVFGGIAQTWEHVAHLYLRRARVGAATLATTPELLAILAQPVGDR